MKNIYTNRYLLSLCGLVLLGVVFLVGLHGYKKWGGSHYFGTVVATSTDTFTIVDRKNSRQLFGRTNDTVVKHGFKVVEDMLQIGDRVIVFGDFEEGNMDARLVRVLGHTYTVVQSQ